MINNRMIKNTENVEAILAPIQDLVNRNFDEIGRAMADCLLLMESWQVKKTKKNLLLIQTIVDKYARKLDILLADNNLTLKNDFKNIINNLSSELDAMMVTT